MKKTHLAFKKPLIRTTICGPKPILGVKNTSYISLNESLKRILYLREYLSSFPGGRLPSVLCALCGPGSRPTTSARRSHLCSSYTHPLRSITSSLSKSEYFPQCIFSLRKGKSNGLKNSKKSQIYIFSRSPT